MADRIPFALSPSQVPAVAEGGVWNWLDTLRWCVAVMDHDDADLGFVASLASHAHKFGDLTDKQAKYARRVVDRIRALWKSGDLQCQREPGNQGLRLIASNEGVAS